MIECNFAVFAEFAAKSSDKVDVFANFFLQHFQHIFVKFQLIIDYYSQVFHMLHTFQIVITYLYLKRSTGTFFFESNHHVLRIVLV
jgi:hypothetical protein